MSLNHSPPPLHRPQRLHRKALNAAQALPRQNKEKNHRLLPSDFGIFYSVILALLCDSGRLGPFWRLLFSHLVPAGSPREPSARLYGVIITLLFLLEAFPTHLDFCNLCMVHSIRTRLILVIHDKSVQMQ
ncbi:Hypothetical_protein [Hexamita inflata]|uniref:Hypothetical_protein n=1 Tax=Hexamita inflata TaxID=28002 RepID=A0AA86P208_9EUKA|nr:Hypothetical protein HINF_LOCUS17796 [Hexamita inflata]